ncbi:DUF1120 domain-containing protein [Serratia entomophila]|uniref:DUF1120 domain-containing protein n=1 Tax=Serratia entomophila TaxID=42906 RepID=UPI00217731F0|nr:DUF1120 domain-containing protein [Serratia entomophila]CAI1046875.1 Protein of uncharacterised function (DUF1120) [Serratia entomophila]CAI1075574.1 Protein of uncharacterised function (DUF1120) [Serratia entomophila]CAI1093289.1 Protein of uncharacterised function (DUF1120) [Serratia entomophila]CAI1096411.1 Protein of uncharacterised function (DUF1120) [Serratia entomophila]CAI1865478.1 Protein of uncharacterised function (DUF1120) [Serratia entomophila]
MNKIALRMMVASTLLAAGASLAAGPSAEIKVVGELVAPTCEVKLPNDGIFDYGSISHTGISRDKAVSLGVKGGAAMEVKCDAETPMTFNVIDNRLGTASEQGKTFGLGNVNATGKLGFYSIRAYFPQVDGALGRLFVTQDSTITSPAGVVQLEHGKRVGWALASSNALAIGKNFTALLSVEAFLAKSGDMHGGIGEDVNLDGSTTLEFGFGL